MTGRGNRRGETGLWMAAAAEVDSPPCLLFLKRGQAATSCCSCFTGPTEPSNNYHTNRNMRTNTSTHEDTPPSRDAGEDTEGGGVEGRKGGWRRSGVAELRLQSGFSLHISFFFLSLCRAVVCTPHPLLHPTALPPLQTQYFPSSSSFFTRTLLTRQNASVPFPLLSAGAHFSPNIFFELCVCACERCLGFKRRCCLCGYRLLFVHEARAQTTAGFAPSHTNKYRFR